MDSAADHQTDGVAGDAGLPDLSRIPIADLITKIDDDSPLAHALRRFEAELDCATVVLKAFDSFAGHD